LFPRTTVAAGISGMSSNSFSINAVGGTTPLTVDFSTTSGSATLVYQVDRTNGVVTISPQDITSAAGLAALTSGLQAGSKVQVYDVPQDDGTGLRHQLLHRHAGAVAGRGDIREPRGHDAGRHRPACRRAVAAAPAQLAKPARVAYLRQRASAASMPSTTARRASVTKRSPPPLRPSCSF
jgi:hypothetical protein